MRLIGKTAIVTGAGNGIGRAIVEKFVAEGANVVGVELSTDACDEVEHAFGSAVRVLCADAMQQKTVDESIRIAKAAFGSLDVMVNNAVKYAEQNIVNTSDIDWDFTIESALTATFRYCRAVIPVMLKQGRGSIVNVSSINQIVANPGLAAYTAAKGGVSALTKQIAMEYGVQGIRCNAVSPALIATARTMQGVTEQDMRLNREAYPVGRIGQGSDVAAAIAFLASDEADFITGVDLPVDGGLTSLAASALLSTRIRGWWGRPPITLIDQ